MEIAKAEESLKAADLCYAQGLYNLSASRAYYAMFQGAQVALEAAGLARLEWSMPVYMRHSLTSSRDGASRTLPPWQVISGSL